MQVKYIKWPLGLDRWTPYYIVYNETKRNVIYVETGIRVAMFEDKIRERQKVVGSVFRGERERSKWRGDK